MPRTKRASRKKLSFNITLEQVEHLLSGALCLEFACDETLAEKCWQRCGDLLTSKWIEVLPGCRPYGWWKYSAPEARRAVQGTAFFDRQPEVFEKYCFGIAPYHDNEKPVYENEADFLLRLGFLTQSETDIPIEKLRKNSVDSYGHGDLDKIEIILQNLGVK